MVGLLFVGLGVAGWVLPGLPGFVFLILALGCFRKGSERFESWLLAHPWWGASLEDWDRNKWLTKRSKCIVSCMICAFSVASIYFFSQKGDVWLSIAIGLLAVVGLVYVVTRKTKPLMADGAAGVTPTR